MTVEKPSSLRVCHVRGLPAKSDVPVRHPRQGRDRHRPDRRGAPRGRGRAGHPAGYPAYCASNSAVDGITKALGCEWGDSGITVNALGPTVFRSPLTQWMFEDSDRSRDVRKGFLTRVPKGRLGEPSDLAGPLLFLASKASDFYTGHILYADGGYTAG